MMPISFSRTLIVGGALLFLAWGGSLCWAHADGVQTGAVAQRTTTDTHTLAADRAAAQEADVKAQAVQSRVTLATSHVTQAKARVTRALAPLTLTATSASVHGDTTPSVVIPALVQTIHAYQQLDTAQTTKDTLRDRQDAAHAVQLAAHQRVDTSATRVIADLTRQKSPRCAMRCGLAIGSGVVIILVVLSHTVLK